MTENCGDYMGDLWRDYKAAEDADMPTTALAAAQALYECDPDDPVLAFILGKSLVEVGRNREAEILLLRAHANYDGDEKPLGIELALGRLYRYWCKSGRAEEWYRRALETAPGDTAPYVMYAALLASLERFREACELLERGVYAEGDVDEVYVNLGLNKRALDDLDGAEHCFMQALAITPNYAAAKAALADVQQALRIRKELERRREI